MAMLLDDRGTTARAARIESLLEEVESLPNPETRATVIAIVQDLLALYGEGLGRMVAMVGQRADQDQPAADAILTDFAADELVSHLLLLHDAHPVDLRTRVERALEEVRPYLRSHAGGVARLRLEGSCNGCPSSTVTLKLAIEEAIRKAAPDLEGIEAEGVAAPEPHRPAGFVPVATLTRRPKAT